jgi:hypothetical protein
MSPSDATTERGGIGMEFKARYRQHGIRGVQRAGNRGVRPGPEIEVLHSCFIFDSQRNGRSGWSALNRWGALPEERFELSHGLSHTGF